MKPIKVLLVAYQAELGVSHLVEVLSSDPMIAVIATVSDETSALESLRRNAPDVVLVDHQDTQLDGFEITRCIMESQPAPVVICTPAAADAVFHSLEAGAVACVEKPQPRAYPERAQVVDHLLTTVKLMSEVRVVRRWGRRSTRPSSVQARTLPVRRTVVGIGASTGGPLVLQTLLSGLPQDFPAPVLVVQHIARGFLPGLVDWLGQSSGMPVHIAIYGQTPLPGHVYVAPDDFQMGLGATGQIVLSRDAATDGLRPSAAHLFRSLAETCGANAIGVLLTGMGKDGAAELKMLRDAGAVTIAQDRESSVVHGMAGEAIALGGACHVVSADKLAQTLLGLVSARHVTKGNRR